MKNSMKFFHNASVLGLLFCVIVSSSVYASEVKNVPAPKQVTGQVKNKATLDNIVAIVNDEVITMQELNQRELTIKAQYAKKGKLPDELTFKKQILHQLIDQVLQRQMAEQLELEADDEDVDKAIEYLANVRNITPAQFEKQILATGITRDEFRDQVHTEVLINRLQQKEIAGKINITEKEVDNYMTTLDTIEHSSKKHDNMEMLGEEPDLKSNPKVRQQMRDLIFRRKFEQNLQSWLAEMRDSATIKIVDKRFS